MTLFLLAIIAGIKNKSVGTGNMIDSKKEIIEIAFQEAFSEKSLMVLSYIDWKLFFINLFFIYSINVFRLEKYNFSYER